MEPQHFLGSIILWGTGGGGGGGKGIWTYQSSDLQRLCYFRYFVMEVCIHSQDGVKVNSLSVLKLVLNYIVKGLKSQLCRGIITAISPEVWTQEFDVITSNEKMAKVIVYLCPP